MKTKVSNETRDIINRSKEARKGMEVYWHKAE